MTLATTATAWTVYVDGGVTATATGTGAGMTSAWTWLFIGADLGSSGGSTLSAATHMANAAYSHAEVYPQILPAARVLAHYCAAATGFGVIPAPQTTAASTVASEFAGIAYTPDGSEYQGSYGLSGLAVTSFGFSTVVTSVIGSYTSGPSARSTICALGGESGGSTWGRAAWVSWSGLAAEFTVYTAATADAETDAGVSSGSGLAFTAGYGGSATSAGVCKVSGGTGASPPASPSALGDTVQQRIERCLGYGLVTYPGRCIDPAALAVQAATDIGGQQTGQNVQNITGSDGGLMYVDNLGNLTYWQKTHLAGQYSSPVWTIGPDTGSPRTTGKSSGSPTRSGSGTRSSSPRSPRTALPSP